MIELNQFIKYKRYIKYDDSIFAEQGDLGLVIAQGTYDELQLLLPKYNAKVPTEIHLSITSSNPKGRIFYWILHVNKKIIIPSFLYKDFVEFI